MTITDASRHHLHSQLIASLGEEAAAVLMEHIPPTGWADVATKHDLDHLRTELELAWEVRFAQLDAKFSAVDARFSQIEGRFAELDARFAELDARFDARLARFESRLLRVTFVMNLAMLTAVAGILQLVG